MQRTHEASALDELPQPDQTLVLIQRQEALSSRGRPPFALVIVDVGPPSEGPEAALRLLHAFRRRARAGDEAGWLTAHKVALILPLTSRDGATRFAVAVCNDARAAGEPPPFEVYPT